MTFNAKIVAQLENILDKNRVLTHPADLELYSHDKSRHHAMPDVVVFAKTTEEIQQIVKLCNEYRVPLTARGMGTGTPGGAVPIHGGVVLSLEKMNKIIAIDAANRVMKVEAGVLNKTVQDAAKEHGLFWAPDPGSADQCVVGGNLAYNASGPRAIKYGTCRENTLGLTAVIGTGEVIHTGVTTTKSAVGYDLTRLLIGSEGTLAIITEATLKLLPLAEFKITLRCLYNSADAAALAITKIMAQSHLPSALEFLDQHCLKLLQDNSDAKAMLLIDIDIQEAEKYIAKAASVDGLIEIIHAKDAEEAERLWSARKKLSPLLKQVASKKINEDVVVPVTQIPALLKKLDQLAQEYQLIIVNFGHGGNGNIHVNLMFEEPQSLQAEACLAKVFECVIQLGGALSGEHGIGIEKQPFMSLAVDAVSLNLMRKIKQQFDPNGILNPGKIF